jgi:hypothetical protein
VDSRDVDAIEDTNIALHRENAELRAELGRMAVWFHEACSHLSHATSPEWREAMMHDAKDALAKWAEAKQEAQP